MSTMWAIMWNRANVDYTKNALKRNEEKRYFGERRMRKKKNEKTWPKRPRFLRKKPNNGTDRIIIELEVPIRRRNEFSKEFVQ